MKTDYRELLIKYIQHVTECESVDFITCGEARHHARVLSSDDFKELETLSAEAALDRNANADLH